MVHGNLLHQGAEHPENHADEHAGRPEGLPLQRRPERRAPLLITLLHLLPQLSVTSLRLGDHLVDLEVDRPGVGTPNSWLRITANSANTNPSPMISSTAPAIVRSLDTAPNVLAPAAREFRP